VRASQLIRVLGRFRGGEGKGRCSDTAVNEVALPHELRQRDTWLAKLEGPPVFFHAMAARRRSAAPTTTISPSKEFHGLKL
jgi:hypothetical protein